MNMADIIAERRKEKGLTQKQLADILGVTDKAVSKWERGNGYPDISYLEPLAAALDVTVSELLKGRVEGPASDSAENARSETIVKNTLDYADTVYRERSLKAPRAIMYSILVLGLVGIITTAIVDFALNSRFTWSLLAVSSIIYMWLCILPLFHFRRRGVDVALLSTSVFLLPFLFVLNRLVGGNWFFSLAVPMAIAGILIAWLIRIIFKTRWSIWYKLAISAIIVAAGNIVISLMAGRILHDGGFDIWNLMSVAILFVIAVILAAVGAARNRRQ